MKYIGKNPQGKQIFLNPDHIVAIIANNTGTKPTEILTSCQIVYEINDTWDIIKARIEQP